MCLCGLSLYVYVPLYVCLCVYRRTALAQAHMWRSEVNVRGLFLLLSTLVFETASHHFI